MRLHSEHILLLNMQISVRACELQARARAACTRACRVGARITKKQHAQPTKHSEINYSRSYFRMGRPITSVGSGQASLYTLADWSVAKGGEPAG